MSNTVVRRAVHNARRAKHVCTWLWLPKQMSQKVQVIVHKVATWNTLQLHSFQNITGKNRSIWTGAHLAF